MATIKEIAELAGVSRGTVDRVLNHRGFVSPDTERKVLEIASLLHYQPNKAGMALAAQKKKYHIGVLLFGEENPFFDEVIDGLNFRQSELSIYGCTTTVRRIPFDLSTQLDAMEELRAEGIHGLILSPYNAAEIREKIDAFWEEGIPCVTVNTDIPHSRRIAYVGSDYYKCGQIAGGLLCLMTHGQTTAGIITGSHNILCHEERISGFSDYIAARRAPVCVTDIIENGDDDYKSYGAVSALLAARPDLNALYFTAAGVYGGCRAILDAGLKQMPVVITFDAVPTTKKMLAKGVITATICQHPKEQGVRSLSLLVDYLLTGELPAQTLVHMNLDIKIRESL